MSGTEIKEIVDSVLWLKWGVAIVASCAGASTAAMGLLVTYIIKAVKTAKEEMQKRLDDMHKMINRDALRTADHIGEVDAVTRELEKNVVRQQGEIDGVIAVCEERHKCP